MQQQVKRKHTHDEHDDSVAQDDKHHEVVRDLVVDQLVHDGTDPIVGGDGDLLCDGQEWLSLNTRSFPR